MAAVPPNARLGSLVYRFDVAVEIEVSDYSSLTKRAGELSLDLSVVRYTGPVELFVDGTG
ncbi:MAG: hypothetical protein J0M17_09470 [Planctomycetes bacterium]|nr:hypothetical protein [Planctomycetota bacterium]